MEKYTKVTLVSLPSYTCYKRRFFMTCYGNKKKEIQEKEGVTMSEMGRKEDYGEIEIGKYELFFKKSYKVINTINDFL
ncbi:hypothetical protein ABW04_22540, partial [Priestia megaterium]